MNSSFFYCKKFFEKFLVLVRVFLFFCTLTIKDAVKEIYGIGGIGMYDTAMRVKLVKIRIRKKQRQHEKFNFYKLAVLCVILSSSLVYMVYDAIGINKAVTYGMYGSILLHEDAGGYIMVAIISFIAAVIITFICIKYKEKEDRRHIDDKNDDEN